MKFKLPAFLEGIESPVEGEVAIRKFANANRPLDLFTPLDGTAADASESAIVVGIDEVGRGPLAGPVVACAAVLKSPDAMPELNDSKKLTRPKREAMFESVKAACACYAIASASVGEIDRLNILEADFLAMRRALQALRLPGVNETVPEIPIEVKGSFADVVRPSSLASRLPPEGGQRLSILIAVDGNLKIRGIREDIQMPVVKGDGRIASISAASILAKVFRDRYMDKLAEKYPGYGFEVNAGYGTKLHQEGIRKFGYTPEHRRSFHPKALADVDP